MKSNNGRFLEGMKIYLREVNADDVNENYYRWMNDPEVTKYTESRFYPNSIEEIKNYVQKEAKVSSSVFLAIISKEDKHIGNIKLHRINWIHRTGEVAIMIGDKSFWGQGIGAEAIRLITEYAFSNFNLHKVYAECYAVNESSIKAFQNAGFEEECLIKKHYFFDGKYVDAMRLCIFRK